MRSQYVSVTEELLHVLSRVMPSITQHCSYHTGNFIFPVYSFMPSLFICSIILSASSFLNHDAMAFALPSLSQTDMMHPCWPTDTPARFSSPTGSQLLSLLSFRAIAGNALLVYFFSRIAASLILT